MKSLIFTEYENKINCYSVIASDLPSGSVGLSKRKLFAVIEETKESPYPVSATIFENDMVKIWSVETIQQARIVLAAYFLSHDENN